MLYEVITKYSRPSCHSAAEEKDSGEKKREKAIMKRPVVIEEFPEPDTEDDTDDDDRNGFIKYWKINSNDYFSEDGQGDDRMHSGAMWREEETMKWNLRTKFLIPTLLVTAIGMAVVTGVAFSTTKNVLETRNNFV